jgi:acetyltransferase-like isoleucine patch superfamily enzyme
MKLSAGSIIRYLYSIIRRKIRDDSCDARYYFIKENPKYANYSTGDFSYGQPKILTWGEGAKLKIGKFCSISTNVTIFLVAEHRPDWITTYPFNILFKDFKSIAGHPSTKGDVIIGNDVWIGSNSTIMSGVTIGDGAVVGACSLVTRNVAPYSIVGGNPARLIRMRFDSNTIDALLKIRWWDWDLKRIKKNMTTLLSCNVRKFVADNFTPEN